MGGQSGPKIAKDVRVSIDSYDPDRNFIVPTRAGSFTRAQNQYMEVNHTFMDTHTGSLSVGCWFRQDNNTQYQQLMTKFIAGGMQWQLQFDLNSRYIFWYCSADGSTWTRLNCGGTNSVSENQWAFVMAVFDFDLGTIKGRTNNGIWFSKAFAGPISSETTPFKLGIQGTSTQPLEGAIDQPFIYNKALGTAEYDIIYNGGTGITLDQYPSQSAIVSAWHMTEDSGPREDVYGGFDLTPQNGATFEPGFVSKSFFDYVSDRISDIQVITKNGSDTYPGGPNYSNNVWTFDGTDDHMEIPYNTKLNPTGDFSVECWCKVNGTTGTYQSPISSRSAIPIRGYLIYVTPGGKWEFWVGNGGWVVMDTTENIVIGDWVHLVLTRNGNDLVVYLNGVSKVTSNLGYIENTTALTRIGGGRNEGDLLFPFNGEISNIRLYDQTLSEQDVLNNYNTLKRRFGIK
jgi:hypothetical protein